MIVKSLITRKWYNIKKGRCYIVDIHKQVNDRIFIYRFKDTGLKMMSYYFTISELNPRIHIL